MVVLIHQDSNFLPSRSCATDYAYDIIVSAMHQWSGIAVPLFFMISGYLFFNKVEEFTASVYWEKCRRRIASLVVPYLCWNALEFLVTLLVILSMVLLLGKPDAMFSDYLRSFNWRMFWEWSSSPGHGRCFGFLPPANNTFPIDIPLWFLRNLIVLSALTPVLHFCLKRFGRLFLALLAAAYLSNTWFDCDVLRISGIFFFSLGAYMSLGGRTMYECFAPWKNVAIVAAVLLAVVVVVLHVSGHRPLMEAVMPFYVLAGVVAVVACTHEAMRDGRLRSGSKVLAQSSFFVFALHTIWVNHLTGVATSKVVGIILSFSPALSRVVTILLSPVLVTTVCVLLFVLMRKFTPSLLGWLTGGRR